MDVNVLLMYEVEIGVLALLIKWPALSSHQCNLIFDS